MGAVAQLLVNIACFFAGLGLQSLRRPGSFAAYFVNDLPQLGFLVVPVLALLVVDLGTSVQLASQHFLLQVCCRCTCSFGKRV
jgi:hypothetical protein